MQIGEETQRPPCQCELRWRRQVGGNVDLGQEDSR